LAYIATLEAVDQGVKRRVDGAVRIANLTVAYLSHGGGDAEVMSVDGAVARNLDLIGVPFETAVERAREWQQLPAQQIAELTDAKDLIRSCAPLSSMVQDPSLSEQLARWTSICDTLP
jgi:hypothetical protein